MSIKFFWVKTDTNGNFTIPNIIAGTNYTLYAFGPGAAGTFQSQNQTGGNSPNTLSLRRHRSRHSHGRRNEQSGHEHLDANPHWRDGFRKSVIRAGRDKINSVMAMTIGWATSGRSRPRRVQSGASV